MDNIEKQLNEIKELLVKQNSQQKEILTIEEAKDYLQLSKSCIYKLTSKREIPFYIPGGKKIYFKRSELDFWIYDSRVTPIQELEIEVENYLSSTNKT